MTDEPLKRCPECRSKVKRLLGTGAGIIFKGSGFYQTDYRSSDYQAAAKKDVSVGSSEESKGASGGDSKGEGKKDSKKPDSKKSESKTAAKTG